MTVVKEAAQPSLLTAAAIRVLRDLAEHKEQENLAGNENASAHTGQARSPAVI